MKALLVYDSMYGNTEQVARAIADALKPAAEIEVLKASEAVQNNWSSIELLIVGSPTQGGRATRPVLDFLYSIPGDALNNTDVMAFDTRLGAFWVKIFGFAGNRIAGSLKNKGGRLLGQPQGFIVRATRGPLEDGEAERASTWAKETVAAAKTS